MESNDNRALITAKNLKTAVRNFLQVLSHIPTHPQNCSISLYADVKSRN